LSKLIGLQENLQIILRFKPEPTQTLKDNYRGWSITYIFC
jgi:hypothetical protein